MDDPNNPVKRWSEQIAGLAVDALVDAGLVRRDQFDSATAIVAEEILVRLCCNDYPPRADDAQTGGPRRASV